MTIDESRLVELYDQGLNDSQIARIMEVSRTTIGIYRRRLNLQPNWERRKSLTEDEKKELRWLHSTGKSIKRISEEMELGISIVRRFFIKEGLDTSAERARAYRRERTERRLNDVIIPVYDYLKQFGPKEEKELVKKFSLNRTHLQELRNVIDIFRFKIFIKASKKKYARINPSYVIRGDKRIVNFIVERCDFTIDSMSEASKMRYTLAEYIGVELSREVIEALGYTYNSEPSMTGSGIHGGKFASLKPEDNQTYLNESQQVLQTNEEASY